MQYLELEVRNQLQSATPCPNDGAVPIHVINTGIWAADSPMYLGASKLHYSTVYNRSFGRMLTQHRQPREVTGAICQLNKQRTSYRGAR